MSVFQVDPSGAMVREAGTFTRTEGADEIRQGVQTGLLIVRGEIPWALNLGEPWFEAPGSEAPGLLSKGTPPEAIASRVRANVASRPGVVDVLELDVSESPTAKDAIQIKYRARISTDDLRQSLLVSDVIGVG